MSELDSRQKAFENKFALDEANLFKAEARACKQFGLWMAEKLGFEGEEAQSYAGNVVSANLEEPGFEDVMRYVKSDLEGNGIDEEEAETKLNELFIAAQEAINSDKS